MITAEISKVDNSALAMGKDVCRMKVCRMGCWTLRSATAHGDQRPLSVHTGISVNSCQSLERKAAAHLHMNILSPNGTAFPCPPWRAGFPIRQTMRPDGAVCRHMVRLESDSTGCLDRNQGQGMSPSVQFLGPQRASTAWNSGES